MLHLSITEVMKNVLLRHSQVLWCGSLRITPPFFVHTGGNGMGTASAGEYVHHFLDETGQSVTLLAATMEQLKGSRRHTRTSLQEAEVRGISVNTMQACGC